MEKGIDKVALGRRIRNIRRMMKLSMEEFGEKIFNVSKSTVYKWENGVYLPSDEKISKLADVVSISESELLFGIQPFKTIEMYEKLIYTKEFKAYSHINSLEEFTDFYLEKKKIQKNSFYDAQLHEDYSDFVAIKEYLRSKENTTYLYSLEQGSNLNPSKNVEELENKIKQLELEVEHLTKTVALENILDNSEVLLYNGYKLDALDRIYLKETFNLHVKIKKMRYPSIEDFWEIAKKYEEEDN